MAEKARKLRIKQKEKTARDLINERLTTQGNIMHIDARDLKKKQLRDVIKKIKSFQWDEEDFGFKPDQLRLQYKHGKEDHEVTYMPRGTESLRIIGQNGIVTKVISSSKGHPALNHQKKLQEKQKQLYEKGLPIVEPLGVHAITNVPAKYEEHLTGKADEELSKQLEPTTKEMDKIMKELHPETLVEKIKLAFSFKKKRQLQQRKKELFDEEGKIISEHLHDYYAVPKTARENAHLIIIQEKQAGNRILHELNSAKNYEQAKTICEEFNQAIKKWEEHGMTPADTFIGNVLYDSEKRSGDKVTFTDPNGWIGFSSRDANFGVPINYLTQALKEHKKLTPEQKQELTELIS